MSGLLALVRGAALGGLVLAALPAALDPREIFDLDPPLWLERVLYDPHGRTATGLEAYDAGELEEAVEAFDAAARLAPDDPLVQYDAGTARLAAGRRGAVEALELAAAGAPPELAADAHYNLGSARLAAGDPAGAVEALTEALRRDPARRDAKHNLELALAELERPRLPLGRPRDAPDGEAGGERGEGEDAAGDERGDESPEARPGPTGTGERQRFDEQEDMSPAEAAALLAAVENLERRLRREQAARRPQSGRAGEENDW